jgi:hypothetical protein
MCSKCRNFTLAPSGQKRRRCSYCGKLINIGKAACAIFDGHDAASNAVKEFNAARGGDEFEKAVERSRDKLHTRMPSEHMKLEEDPELDDIGQVSGKGARLMLLLQKEASMPCSLGKIEDLCTSYQLEWSWVEKQLIKLSNSGQVIFPRPWQVQLVEKIEQEPDEEPKLVDVSSEILVLLEERGSTKISAIWEFFEERGISQESVEVSLEALMKKGEIFEPSQGTVKVV